MLGRARCIGTVARHCDREADIARASHGVSDDVVSEEVDWGLIDPVLSSLDMYEKSRDPSDELRVRKSSG